MDAVQGASEVRDQDVLKRTLRERTERGNTEMRRLWKFILGRPNSCPQLHAPPAAQPVAPLESHSA